MTKTEKSKTKRQLQIGEEIRRAAAREIVELIDTRIDGDFLTIMKAEISKDLRYCKIFYRCKVANQKHYQTQLDAIALQLTNILYKKLALRLRPEIRFVFDDTMKIIEEIERVVEKNKGFL